MNHNVPNIKKKMLKIQMSQLIVSQLVERTDERVERTDEVS